MSPSRTGPMMARFPWKPDPAAAGIIAFGLVLRVALYLTGRNPIDGDEGVMGMMGADMARLIRFPLHFYGQHYMGTLEVPLTALLQSLGPEAWKFCAWPVRLTGWTYFALLGTTHFLLCRHFFGRRTALWALFFICAGPFFWMDYSVRLRHAPLMMVMGEVVALSAISVCRRWREEGGLAAWRWGLFGLWAGLSWWHYQLVLVFYPAILVLLLNPPSPVGVFLARLPEEPPLAAVRRVSGIAAMALVILVLAQLSLGRGSAWIWNHRDTIRYSHIMMILIVVFAIGFWLAGGMKRGGAPGEQARRAPACALLGFLAGCSPVIFYLVTLKREFWVVGYSLDTSRILTRMWDILMLETAGFLEVVRYGQDNPSLAQLGVWTYVTLTGLGAGLICLTRAVIKPRRPEERLGAVFFIVLGVTTLFLNVITPHSTTLEKPRFIFPVMLSVSVMTGLFASALIEGIRGEGVRSRVARIATGAFIATGAVGMWGANWLAMRPVEMDWPSGLERENVTIIRELEAHGVRRAVLRYSTDFMLLGHNLMFASRMRIRFNEEALTDRFMDILDPRDFPGPLYAMVIPTREIRPGEPAKAEWKNGFSAGPFFVYPLPPGGRLYTYYPMPPASAPQEAPHARD